MRVARVIDRMGVRRHFGTGQRVGLRSADCAQGRTGERIEAGRCRRGHILAASADAPTIIRQIESRRAITSAGVRADHREQCGVGRAGNLLPGSEQIAFGRRRAPVIHDRADRNGGHTAQLVEPHRVRGICAGGEIGQFVTIHRQVGAHPALAVAIERRRKRLLDVLEGRVVLGNEDRVASADERTAREVVSAGAVSRHHASSSSEAREVSQPCGFWGFLAERDCDSKAGMRQFTPDNRGGLDPSLEEIETAVRDSRLNGTDAEVEAYLSKRAKRKMQDRTLIGIKDAKAKSAFLVGYQEGVRQGTFNMKVLLGILAIFVLWGIFA